MKQPKRPTRVSRAGVLPELSREQAARLLFRRDEKGIDQRLIRHAFRTLESIAKTDSTARYVLATILSMPGPLYDRARSIREMTSAFYDGVPDAADFLANCYPANRRTMKGIEKRVEWLENGYTVASMKSTYELAMMTLMGLGKKRNFKQGVQLLYEASLLPDALAARTLIGYFAARNSIERFLAERRLWLVRWKSCDALVTLTALSLAGLEPPIPQELTLYHLTKAARQDSVAGCWNLYQFWRRQAGSRAKARAEHWFDVACSCGLVIDESTSDLSKKGDDDDAAAPGIEAYGKKFLLPCVGPWALSSRYELRPVIEHVRRKRGSMASRAPQK